MSDALHEFALIQVGKETVKGTLVAATKQLVADYQMTEEQDFYRSPYPRNVRSNVGGAGVITRTGSQLAITADLTAEELPLVLSSGVRGGLAPANANSEFTWTCTPELGGYPTLDSLTFELVQGDGATNHYAQRFGYGLTSGFKIDWAFNTPGKLTWNVFGRQAAANAPTAALAPYTGREPLVTNLLSVYSDATFANVGATQLNTIVRSASLDVKTGLGADYTADGRSAKDMTQHKGGPLTATLDLVLEFDATGAARSFTDYRANSLRYMRLKNIGSNVNTNPRYVQIDGAWRFASPPAISYDGSQVLVAAKLESVYDDTNANALLIKVVNGQSSL